MGGNYPPCSKHFFSAPHGRCKRIARFFLSPPSSPPRPHFIIFGEETVIPFLPPKKGRSSTQRSFFTSPPPPSSCAEALFPVLFQLVVAVHFLPHGPGHPLVCHHFFPAKSFPASTMIIFSSIFKFVVVEELPQSSPRVVIQRLTDLFGFPLLLRGI